MQVAVAPLVACVAFVRKFEQLDLKTNGVQKLHHVGAVNKKDRRRKTGRVLAMCIVFFAYGCHPQYKLIILSNRDEYYDRPTAIANFWEVDGTTILAGKDLLRGGTWAGINPANGRFAVVTNYRVPFHLLKPDKRSRGEIVCNFLSSTASAQEWTAGLNGDLYDLFNIVVYDGEELYYYSNKEGGARRLTPGHIYGVCNELLDSPWPKLLHGKKQLGSIIEEHIKEGQTALADTFFDNLHMVLNDRTCFPDESLPETGVGLEWERIMQSIFVQHTAYGTRSSTVIVYDNEDHVTYSERAGSVNEKGQLDMDKDWVKNTYHVKLPKADKKNEEGEKEK